MSGSAHQRCPLGIHHQSDAIMTYTIAIVADPYLERLLHTDQAYMDMLWNEFQKFPKADQFLTAVSQPVNYYISNIWRSRTWFTSPLFSVHGPQPNNLYQYTPHKNSRIMSQTLSGKNGLLPNLVMVQSHLGLLNLNAQLNANIRMLDNKKHKPDLIVFIDPRDTIANFSNVNSKKLHDQSVAQSFNYTKSTYPNTQTHVIV